ncbi:MAG: histidine phosphatase family protein [archaeon]
MKIIVVRHGETLENIDNVCQGKNHGTLSEKGIMQGKKLAKRLKDEEFDLIFSSDLARALDTAKEIVKYHPNHKIIIDKRLQERDLKYFEGKPFPDDWNWGNLPSDVETASQIKARAKDLIDELYDKYPNKTIILATHLGLQLALFAVILKKSMSEISAMGRVGNTAVSIVEITEDKNHEIHLLNCTKHLN